MKPTISFSPLLFGALLLVVAAATCVHAAALYHFPTRTRPAAVKHGSTSVRGGGFFGGKAPAAKRPSTSTFLDSIASAAGEKVSAD
jgi:hypothetical protein